MHIVSWNVNGLRACTRKGFASWLKRSRADVVAVQESRVLADDLPAEIRRLRAWELHLTPAERKGYSGVALLSRRAPEQVETQLGEPRFDREGRYQLATFGRLQVVNSYFPNGNHDLSRVPYKLDYYRRLFRSLQPAFQNGQPILVVGDFNTAHRPIDLARPKDNEKYTGFLPEERAELDRWLEAGWVDTFRHLHPEDQVYSWWSQRYGVRERNVGWRIDYVLASPGAMPYLRQARIHTKVKGSDHCPVSVDMKDAVLG